MKKTISIIVVSIYTILVIYLVGWWFFLKPIINTYNEHGFEIAFAHFVIMISIGIIMFYIIELVEWAIENLKKN